jgi:sphingolipid delta-4 desaturase
MALTFATASNREPHRGRHHEILRRHPEIRSLYGHDPRTGAITYAVVVAQLGIACALQRLADAGSLWGAWWSVAIAAYAVGAFAAKWCGVAIHESSHNLVYRTTPHNLAFAFVANLPVLVPAAAFFRRYHLDHHAFMGVHGRDNDLPTRWELVLVGRSSLLKLLWVCLFVIFGTLARGFVKWPNRWEVANALIQLAVDVVLFEWLGWTAIVYLALSLAFSFGLHPVAGNFIHEHYLWNGHQETWSYYGPLNKLTLNLGYHTEHHDFMRVPSRRLPELRTMAAEYYDPLESHRSWTWVLWHFIRSPEMGHFSRITRTLDADRRAS